MDLIVTLLILGDGAGMVVLSWLFVRGAIRRSR
ncbi:hypothetical protein EDD38_3283 [Kitasatospora cineracea]|uniref:Uncharacterized protein n=1 Tax=Kitasatospora cineracea TaxID=88074 RepID=A0A3N4S8D0_9ACTN|nr:hypothetical protein EDD38_3283 [Kitasatospora cineracea]